MRTNPIFFSEQNLILNELKQLLREDGFSYDPWAVCMSAWFQVAAHLYEVGDCPREWQYKPGCAGNIIDPEDSYTWFLTGKTDEQLTLMGNYLERISQALKRSGKSY